MRTRRLTFDVTAAAAVTPIALGVGYLINTSEGAVAAVVFASIVMLIHLIHESGHAAAIIRCGGDATMSFTFIGSHIKSESSESFSWRSQALTAACGPAAGFVAALLLLPIPYHPVRLAAALSIAFNALDLLPLPPLDGYRIVSAFAARRGGSQAEVRLAQNLWFAVVFIVWLAAIATNTRWVLAAAVVTSMFTAAVVVMGRFNRA